MSSILADQQRPRKWAQMRGYGGGGGLRGLSHLVLLCTRSLINFGDLTYTLFPSEWFLELCKIQNTLWLLKGAGWKEFLRLKRASVMRVSPVGSQLRPLSSAKLVICEKITALADSQMSNTPASCLTIMTTIPLSRDIIIGTLCWNFSTIYGVYRNWGGIEL